MIVRKDKTDIITRTNITTSHVLDLSQTELDFLYRKLINNESINLTFVLITYGTNNTKWSSEETVLCQFTGNQKTVYVRKKRAKAFVNIDENWKKAVVWIKENDKWKRCV